MSSSSLFTSTAYDTTNPSASIPAFPTVAELILSLQQAIQAQNGLITNFNPGGVTQTLIESVSILLGSDASTLSGVNVQGAYEILLEAIQSAFAVTAQNAALDLKGADVATIRKLENTATTQLQFSLPNPAPAGGTIFPAGTICQAEQSDPTQTPLLFSTNAPTSALEGQTQASATVSATCLSAGSSGNVPAGAINVCISNSAFLVTNPGKASGGLDRELDDGSDGGYRKRVLAAIPNASQCTISAIEDDALQYPVTSAILVENTADDGVTLEKGLGQLYVDDGSGNLSDPSNTNYAAFVALKNAFTAGYYRAAGTQVHVNGSTSLTVGITLSIIANSAAIAQGATESMIAAAVQTQLYSFVDALTMGNPVQVASIVAEAKETTVLTADVPAVSNVIISSVLINGTNNDVVTAVNELPRILPTIAAIVVTVVGTAPFS